MFEQDSSSLAAKERRREQNRLAQQRFRQRHDLRGKKSNASASRASRDGNQADEPDARSRPLSAIEPASPSNPPRAVKRTPGSDSTINQDTEYPDFDFFMDFGDSLNVFPMPEAPSTVFTAMATPPDTTAAVPVYHSVRDGPRAREQHLVRSKSDRLDTPLHAAAGRGSAKIVQVLLQHGADCNARGVEGKTPLAHTVIGDHESAADILLSRGAQVLAVDDQQRSALHLAVTHGRERILRILIRHCASDNGALDVCDVQGNTPLHLAINMNLDSLVEVLCEAGANVQLQPGAPFNHVI